MKQNKEWLDAYSDRLSEFSLPTSSENWSKVEQKLEFDDFFVHSGIVESQVDNSLSMVFHSYYKYIAIAAVFLVFLGLYNLVFVSDEKRLDSNKTEFTKSINNLKNSSPLIENGLFLAKQNNCKKETKIIENKINEISYSLIDSSCSSDKIIVLDTIKNSKENNFVHISKKLNKEDDFVHISKKLNKEDDFGTVSSVKKSWILAFSANSGVLNCSDDEFGPSNMSSFLAMSTKNYELNGNRIVGMESLMRKYYNHKRPINFGISIIRELTPRCFLSTGIVYSYLFSDVQDGYGQKQVQNLHYIGIPLSINYKFFNNLNYSIYTGVGGIVHKCIFGKLGNKKISNKELQYSLEYNVGVQYNLTSQLGLYLEPNVSCNFDNGSDVRTFWSDNDFSFNFQIGVRFKY